MSLAPKGVPVTLQSAATATGNGVAFAVNPALVDHAFFLKGSGTIASGTIILEEAEDENFAGTWSQLASVAASSLTAGAASVFHVAGVLSAVRARISVIIAGGGNITVTFMSRGSV